jgi:hypothetical protein
MTVEQDQTPVSEESPEPQRHGCLGCLPWVLGALAALILLGIVLGFAFDQDGAGGGDSGLNAGTAEDFARGDITYLERDHIFIVRKQDGEFVALYDRSPKQQELGSDCRVRYNETIVLPQLQQLPGFTGAIIENCEERRTFWRVDGALATGAGYGDLDRFETRVENGDLIVDTSSRTCTKSRGVIGIPPFDVTTCKGNPD